MDPYIIPKFEQFLVYLKEQPLNIFTEQNIKDLREFWESNKPEPIYIDFIQEKYAAGEYTSAQQIKDDFTRYITTSEQTIQKLPENEQLIFLSILGFYRKKFSKKLEKALRNEVEEALAYYDKLIDQTKLLLKDIPSNIWLDSIDQPQIDTFGLPRKIFPNYDL